MFQVTNSDDEEIALSVSGEGRVHHSSQGTVVCSPNPEPGDCRRWTFKCLDT